MERGPPSLIIVIKSIVLIIKLFLKQSIMKNIQFLLINVTFLLFIIQSYGQEIIINGNNPTEVRKTCNYWYSGPTSVEFEGWVDIPYNCCQVNSSGIPLTDLETQNIYFKWKNVEESAYISTLKAKCFSLESGFFYITKVVNPFTLNFRTPSFVGGLSKHIDCSASPFTISLSPYINTDGCEENELITSHFEWTLPSGWRTTEGNTGTFVSTSSISVIPPASTSPATISVRAKANTQYSTAATLQITRDLQDFTIQGPSTVDCNATQRYTVPQIPGATYTWQNQSGWMGQSTTNYIDVTAQNTPNCTLVCTISVCGQSKVAQKAITANLINPSTSITGPSSVCSSYEVFSFTNPAPMNFIGWTCSSNLRITSGNMMSPSCTVERIGGGSGWLKVELTPKCGGYFEFEKIIEPGIAANISGPSYIPLESSGSWTANASGCAPFHYQWWLRELSSPDSGILIGEGNTLTLVSYPRYGLAVSKNQSLFSQALLQPPSSTNYYLKLQVSDAFGNIFTTSESHILAEGDVDLINVNQGAVMPNSGVEKTTSTQLNISPNPTEDEATVELNNAETPEMSGYTNWQLEIYDATQSLKTKIQQIKGNRQTIRTSGWKEGVYIVRARVGNQLLIDKLIVK